jgi:hypothetical protein
MKQKKGVGVTDPFSIQTNLSSFRGSVGGEGGEVEGGGGGRGEGGEVEGGGGRGEGGDGREQGHIISPETLNISKRAS